MLGLATKEEDDISPEERSDPHASGEPKSAKEIPEFEAQAQDEDDTETLPEDAGEEISPEELENRNKERAKSVYVIKGESAEITIDHSERTPININTWRDKVVPGLGIRIRANDVEGAEITWPDKDDEITKWNPTHQTEFGRGILSTPTVVSGSSQSLQERIEDILSQRQLEIAYTIAFLLLLVGFRTSNPLYSVMGLILAIGATAHYVD